MEQVFEMNGLRVVDLTKPLDPKNENRRCWLWRYNTGGPIPDYHTIMDLTSHLGTHCECPYHHDDNWPSVAELPLTTFMGRALYVVLDLPENHQITGEDLEKAIGNRVREGDVVLLDSPHKLPPFTPATNGPDDHRLVVDVYKRQLSTYANAYVMNCVVIEAINMLVNEGVNPPVWRSGNCPGGDEWNNQFLERFRGAVRCL